MDLRPSSNTLVITLLLFLPLLLCLWGCKIIGTQTTFDPIELAIFIFREGELKKFRLWERCLSAYRISLPTIEEDTFPSRMFLIGNMNMHVFLIELNFHSSTLLDGILHWISVFQSDQFPITPFLIESIDILSFRFQLVKRLMTMTQKISSAIFPWIFVYHSYRISPHP